LNAAPGDINLSVSSNLQTGCNKPKQKRMKEIIFFSYSRPDSTFALKLAKDLRNAGVQL
jgi:hypothetical protein